MQLKRRDILSTLGFSLAMISLPHRSLAAQSQWPNSKPIRLIVGFAAGGPTDLVARVLAKRLSDQLKAPVVVDNRAGANGNIAAELVAKAAPDGFTFLYNSSSLSISPSLYRRLSFDPLKDFSPVAATAAIPLVLVVEASSSVRDFKSWISFVRANNGKLNYGSPGAGNPGHLGMAMLLKANDLDATHVAYKGSSEALTGLLSKQTQFQIDSSNSVLPHLMAGRLRAIAVLSLNRVAVLPNVPTVSESGMPGFEIGSWQGVMAPAQSPKDIVQRLSKELGAAMASEEVKKILAAQGAYSIASSPGDYAAYFRTEQQRYAKTVQDIGLKFD